MSAIGGKADIGRTCSDVRLGQAQGSQAAHVLDHGGEAHVGVEQLMAIKRIGILTGGGDVPGLNAVIKSATYRSSENDIEIFGLRRGWEALTHLNIEDASSRSHYVIQLNRENTRTIDRYGGTVLHTSRTNPSRMRKLPTHLAAQDFPASLSAKGEQAWDVSKQVLANLSALGIEHLIAIGGDDTLGYAAKLNKLGASRSLPFRRRWTTTSVTLSTASASRRRSLAPAMPSNGSGLPSVRMNGSAFFAFSGVTPGLPLSIPHTRPRSAVSFPSTG